MFNPIDRVMPVNIIAYLLELNQLEMAENYLYLLGELHYKNGCLDTMKKILREEGKINE